MKRESVVYTIAKPVFVFSAIQTNGDIAFRTRTQMKRGTMRDIQYTDEEGCLITSKVLIREVYDQFPFSPVVEGEIVFSVGSQWVSLGGEPT